MLYITLLTPFINSFLFFIHFLLLLLPFVSCLSHTSCIFSLFFLLAGRKRLEKVYFLLLFLFPSSSPLSIFSFIQILTSLSSAPFQQRRKSQSQQKNLFQNTCLIKPTPSPRSRPRHFQHRLQTPLLRIRRSLVYGKVLEFGVSAAPSTCRLFAISGRCYNTAPLPTLPCYTMSLQPSHPVIKALLKPLPPFLSLFALHLLQQLPLGR